MALEIIGFAIAGCFLGILSGIVPGLHVNTIALLALAMPKTNSLGLVVLIASMSVVHTFVDFLPSVLLGAPSNDTFLAALPGHRLLMKGKGLLAVKLTIAGGLFSGLGAIALGPVFLAVIEKSHEMVSAGIPFFLCLVLVAMALSGKRFSNTMIMALSAALGLIALQELPVKQPLFCLATGFFGASALLDSLFKNPVLPKQGLHKLNAKKGPVFKNSVIAVLGGSLVSLMPGIGASQAGFLARKALGKIPVSEYLVLLGGINTATMILSFFVLFSWGKTRTGSAAAIGQLLPFRQEELLVVTAACVMALGFGAIAADLLSKKMAKVFAKINYRKANAVVLCFITGMVFAFSGLLGLLVYATAAFTGLAAINLGVRRSNTMSFLIVPTMANYAAGLI